MKLDEQHSRLGQELDAFTDQIIEQARQALHPHDENGQEHLREGISKTQLSNFLRVTLDASSPFVVTTWIKYQRQRDREARKTWNNSGLGQAVLRDISELENMAKQVAQQVFSDVEDSHVRRAHIGLVRRYAGYLRQWWIASGGKDDEQS